MKNFLVRISLDHPRWVIGISALITLIFAALTPRIRVDTDPENMLPADEPVRVDHREVTEAFGLHDYLVVGIVREEGVFRPETLARVAALTQEIREMPGVLGDDVLAPTEVDDISTNADGTLVVAPLMESVPSTREDAERILARIRGNPVLRGKLASDDGAALALFVPLESKKVSARVAAEIRRALARYGFDEHVYLAGIPLAQDTFGHAMFQQMAFSAPIAFLVIFLLMLFFFRKPAIVLAPMIVSMMSVIWTMGLLIGLGFTVHIMSSMIPIFLIPTAVLESIHMLSEFHERYPKHRDMRRTIRETMDELFQPMFYTYLTTFVGFAALVLTPIPPVQVFGAFVAFGVTVAWLLTMTFTISYATLVPAKTLESFGATPESGVLMRRSMRFLRDFSLRARKPIVLGGVLLLALSAVGLSRLVVNDNPVKWFKAGHPLRVADDVLNAHLAGTYLAYLEVSAQGDEMIKDPEVLRWIEGLQRRLEQHPNVGATTSVADIVRKVGAELRPGTKDAELPSDRGEIAQYLFLYEISGGDPDDLFKLVTPEYDRANLWVQMRRGENRDVNSVAQAAAEYARENPPPGVSMRWAGLPYINVLWQQKMVAGMGKSDAFSSLSVFLMMVVLFRSFRLGLISMIPLTATILLVYAFIGFVGKPYDMPIAVLSSLTLGLSIDFAIHFLQRLRELYRATGTFRAAIEELFETPSHAIARNILVIAIGFVPMFFASLVPYITVAAFFVAIMLISGAATLITLPAILSFLNPRILSDPRLAAREPTKIEGDPAAPASEPAATEPATMPDPTGTPARTR